MSSPQNNSPLHPSGSTNVPPKSYRDIIASQQKHQYLVQQRRQNRQQQQSQAPINANNPNHPSFVSQHIEA